MILTLPQSETNQAFRNWCDERRAEGVKLIVLEGFPTSGKTTLAQAAGGVDLDDWRPSRDDVDEITWVEHVTSGDAVWRVRESIAKDGFVVVAGVAAWPAMADIVNALRDQEVRRVFVKRVTFANGHKFWDEALDFGDPVEQFGRYIGSYYSYLAEDKPWCVADLVIERVEGYGSES
jgi:hypothetical protein